jgi:flagellar hook assembly protein FlgD
VAVPALPATLYQNYPNPFNPSTSIEFYVPRESRVAVDIYDVSGRRVANLADAVMEKGLRRVVWNGVDEAGSRATSGMYFYTVKIGKESLTRKMVLMR